MGKWPTIENMVTPVIAGALFVITKSPWSFIVLLNLNTFSNRK